jgi:hypothetical protein
MGKKLSITQRSYDKTGWHKSSQFSTSDIKDIKISKAGNDKSLNAIPSPFARIHVFEAAFDLLDKDELNNTDYSGDTFKKLVSDCFDVFELLYNWNNHIRDDKKLSIVKWNRNTEIENLKRSRARHKLLGETLEVFFNENAFENFEDIFIVKYKNRPIAGSSPFTGFFTAPGGALEMDLYNPINRGNYFSKIIPFANRKPEIKRYILDFFNKTNLQKSDATKVVRTYLRRHAVEIPDDVQIPLELISLPDSQRIELFGQPLRSSSKRTEIDYFEKYLIKINYRINDDFFYNPLIQGDEERNYDYLLPLTPVFFEDFRINDINQIVSIIEKDLNSIEVSIQVGNNKITKRYHNNNVFSGTDGQLIDLADLYSIKINLGIYPFLKINNSVSDVDYNDFYKVAFMMQDDSNHKSNSDFTLKFGKNGRLIENGDVYRVERSERTIESDISGVGSTFYSINTFFEFIQLEFINLGAVNIRNTIIPKWREKTLGNDKIDYSIDFGTTTTFIAYTDDPNHQREPKAFEISIKDIQVAMLNKPLKKRDEYTWEAAFETTPKDFPESIAVQKQEFLPSILSSGKYKFPIRTVLFQKLSVPDNRKSLFSNANIAFTYQREANKVTHLGQEYLPDLKWNIQTNDNYKTSTKVYLEELFYLLRTKTLMNSGNPQNSKITWFSPLSLTPAAKHAYSEMWQDLFFSIFKSSEASQISNLTESEAPYYFLNKQAKINNLSSVLTLDIGGGSTDIMLFQQNKPVVGTSVHFGANVLWGNGFNEFKTDKSNGIFKTIKDKVSANLHAIEELEDYNAIIVKEYGSDEIINFWLLNDNKSKVVEELKNKDFKLSYLLHLSSLIYHSISFLKSQNYKVPSCIIFSGNGSKYIDLIQSNDYIEKICGYIARSVFKDKEINNPQVILPQENRKEATCYGGLYRPVNTSSYKAINYIGFEDKSDDYKKYVDIDLKRDIVFDNIVASFNEFIELFFNMNEEEDLSFRSHFRIEGKLRAIKHLIKEKALENLSLGYDKRRSKVDSQDTISDSLFFYPLVGLIFKLNNLTSNDLEAFIAKTTFYGLSPDGENEFFLQRLANNKKPDSIFTITVNDDNPNIGELNIIDNPSVHRKALGLVNSYLKPVSDWDEIPRQADQEIKIIKPGIVERQGDKWIVKERLKLEFV